MSDFGIKVTQKGKDLDGAQLTDEVLNTRWPFAKLDVTNPAAFQNFRIVFNNDAPYDTSGAVKRTEIYRFKHNCVDPQGNKLVPAVWLLGSNTNTTGGAQAYFEGGGQIAATTPGNPVLFVVNWDADNVYFYVDKYYDTSASSPFQYVNIAGTILNIRTYVFVEDLQF